MLHKRAACSRARPINCTDREVEQALDSLKAQGMQRLLLAEFEIQQNQSPIYVLTNPACGVYPKNWTVGCVTL